MMDGTQQEKEIQTIRERTFSLKLSDSDIERLAAKAARGGLTMEQLLENFIGDLVCGTYYNGSDERMYAQEWFDRCWFGSYGPMSGLLQHLARMDSIEYAFDLQEKLRYSLEDAQDEELTPEERAGIQEDVREVQAEIAELFGPYTDPAEWQKVVMWRAQVNEMLGRVEEL